MGACENMRILFFDIETSGVDFEKDRIIELGASLWDWIPEPRPLVNYEKLIKIDSKLEPVITELTGITDEILEEFGGIPPFVFQDFIHFVERHSVDYFFTHNGKAFDMPFLFEEFKRANLNYKVIEKITVLDSRFDLPFKKDPASRKLAHLAAEHNICPQKFSHRALADALTTARLVACYDIDKIIEYSAIPFIAIRAVVSYEQRQLAKDAKFSWEKVMDKTYPKLWVKLIKADQWEVEVEKWKPQFQIVKLV